METLEQDATMWVPICCGRVMRHHMFPGPKGVASAASLTCVACGKHILLGPEPVASVLEYGKDSRLIRLLGTPSAVTPKAAAVNTSPGAGLDDETMA